MNPDKISNEDYVVDNDEIMEDATQETNTQNDKDEQEIEKMKSREVLEKTKTVHENSPSAFMDNSVSNQQASNNDQPVEGNRRLRRLQAKANRKKKKR